VEIMARRINGPSQESLQAAKALNCVIKAAGANGMVAGQMSDILNEGKSINLETLNAIHSRKTGCLFTACFEAGGLLGAGDASAVEALALLGKAVGLAFQIKDDILDITATEETLGKPIGSDSKNQKSTYVTIYGLKGAEDEYRHISDKIMEMLKTINCKTSTLEKLVIGTLSRTK